MPSLLEVLLFCIVEYCNKKHELCLFLTPAPDRGEWSALHLSPFIPSKKSQLNRRLVGPGAGLDVLDKRKLLSLLGIEPQIVQLVD